MADKKRYALPALLGASLLLSAAYAFNVVPGNAPDEREHFEYVLHVANHHTLPVWNWPQDKTTWQARQPPLYYALQAAVLSAAKGLPPLDILHLLRLFSSLFHLGAIFIVWRLARSLYGDTTKALAPPLLLAALPMFTFIGASVTNDAGANLTCALLLFVTASALAAGKTPDRWLVAALGGVALLTKISTLPIVLLCLIFPWSVVRGPWRNGLLKVMLPALVVVLIAGWFYLRNFLMYGDAVGIGARFQEYDPDRYTWSQLPLWLSLFFQSFWGRFGQMTQPMSSMAYTEAAVLSVAALSGWIHGWDRLSKLPARKFLLAALGLAVLQNFVVGFFMSYQPQARFTFIAAAAWAVLMTDGFDAFLHRFPEPLRTRLFRASLVLLAFLNVDAYLHL